jgi:CheY-like chemotaxis protein
VGKTQRRVLLVEPDVDRMGRLAEALRARGLTVSNASDPFEAVEQAYRKQPDAFLVSAELDSESDLTAAIRAIPDLSSTPIFRVVDRPLSELEGAEVPLSDVDALVARLLEALPRESHAAEIEHLRGSLAHTPLPDLLQLLSMNQRSGSLALTTPAGAGEVRLSHGEIVAISLRGFRGVKALARILAEGQGSFAFTPGAPGDARPTSSSAALVMEGLRQVDELRARRAKLACEGFALSLVDAPPAEISSPSISLPSRALGGSDSGPISAAGEGGEGRARGASVDGPGASLRDLGSLLAAPATLDELLDDLPEDDLSIVEALLALDESGKLRRTPLSALTVPLATREQLPVLRSLVSRLTRGGFHGPPRLVLVGSRRRLGAMGHALRRILDAVGSNEPSTTHLAVPRVLGEVRLGEGVTLAIVGVPSEEVYAPLWGLALAGSSAVVRLRDGGTLTLAEHCESVDAPLFEAEELVPSLDPADPADVAQLVRTVIERASGL